MICIASDLDPDSNAGRRKEGERGREGAWAFANLRS